jgi:hypothetical protein
MTSPTTPEPDQRMREPGESPRSASSPPAQARPSGATGGHTVQDWEQPAARRHGAPNVPASQGPAAPALPEVDEADAPSPPTTPLYLRSASRREAAVTPPAFDARKQTLTAQSAAIVDSITLGLADALAVSLRPVVASTIEALIPMILSLGSVPEDSETGESDVGAPAKDHPAAS